MKEIQGSAGAHIVLDPQLDDLSTALSSFDIRLPFSDIPKGKSSANGVVVGSGSESGSGSVSFKYSNGNGGETLCFIGCIPDIALDFTCCWCIVCEKRIRGS